MCDLGSIDKSSGSWCNCGAEDVPGVQPGRWAEHGSNGQECRGM